MSTPRRERTAARCGGAATCGRGPAGPALPSYKDGGPSDNNLPIWKAAAPALDMISPDDYARDAAGYIKMLEIYGRNDNPLFIPETGGSPRFFFLALGH